MCCIASLWLYCVAPSWVVLILCRLCCIVTLWALSRCCLILPVMKGFQHPRSSLLTVWPFAGTWLCIHCDFYFKFLFVYVTVRVTDLRFPFYLAGLPSNVICPSMADLPFKVVAVTQRKHSSALPGKPGSSMYVSMLYVDRVHNQFSWFPCSSLICRILPRFTRVYPCDKKVTALGRDCV